MTLTVVDTIKILPWSDRIDKITELHWGYMHNGYSPETYLQKLTFSDHVFHDLMKYVSGRSYNIEYMTVEQYRSMFEDVNLGEVDLTSQTNFDGNVMYWAVN